MPELQDFQPLYTVTIDEVRARIDADVNAGLTSADPGWIDTTPGGWYYDITQPAALEAERLWDMASVDLPASMFIGWAWGDYLDLHGQVLGIERDDAVRALGEVTFTGDNGTPIETGLRVATEQQDPDADPVEFETTESGTISAGTLTLAVQAVVAGSEGNVPLGAVSIVVSPGDGVSDVTNAAAITGGEDVQTDESYRDEILAAWKQSTGSGTVSDLERWARAYPGVGYATAIPTWAGPTTAKVVVTSAENKPVALALVQGLQEQLDPISASTTLSVGVTLPTGTLTVPSTSGFRDRGSLVVAGGQIVQYTGRTGTTFTGCSGGSGAVIVGATVEQHGLGGGQAPIGQIVKVTTPATVSVAVAGTVFHATGYSLDGDNGTIATRDDIEEVVGDYLDSLKPGADVVLNSVLARFFLVPGVTDVATLRLEGSAGNLPIGDDEVAEAGAFTLA